MFLMPSDQETEPNQRGEEPGVVIRRRMSDVGLSQADVAQSLGKSQGWVSQYLFRDTSRTLRRMLVDSPEMLERLADALQWPLDALLREARLTIPGISIFSQTKSAGESRLIPLYALDSHGKLAPTGEFPFTESWEGAYDAYRLEFTQGSYRRTTVIARRQSFAQPGNEVIAETEERGVVVAEVVGIEGGTYFLQSEGEPFVARNVTVRGVVMRRQEDREPLRGN